MSSTTAPSTSYTGGALPTYGSDLRPPAASVPAGSPSPPPSVPNPPPTSGSPSTTPAAGSGGGVAHAGATRSELAPTTSQQQAPVGLAGKAVAAGAAGAVAGAASADATARIRLQRIVDAVARQESRLAWAAGDRPDDTTILLTDLADGWIPPGIEIPASVTLLEPGRRRGDLEALLGEVERPSLIRLTATCPKQMSRCPRLHARGMRRRSRNWVGSHQRHPLARRVAPSGTHFG